MLYVLMERWPASLRAWYPGASEADKARARTLTYELYDALGALGLRLEDISADNVLVRTHPLRVAAIDFDPTMTLEDDDVPSAQKAMRGAAECVFEGLDLG